MDCPICKQPMRLITIVKNSTERKRFWKCRICGYVRKEEDYATKEK